MPVGEDERLMKMLRKRGDRFISLCLSITGRYCFLGRHRYLLDVSSLMITQGLARWVW